MLRIAAALALCLPLAGSARAQGAAPRSAEVVSLHFGWQPGHAADVVEKRERVSGGASIGAVTLQYRLAVRADGDELVVERSDLPASAPPPGALVLPEASLRITRAGAFASIAELGALQERTRAALRTQLGEDGAASATALIEGLAQPAALAARARGDWNLLVENWLGGRAYALGAVYELRAQEERPDGPVQLAYEIGAARRAPCSASETRLRCVELGMRWSPAPEHVERAVRSQLGALIPEKAKLEASAMRTEVRLVAEPETLLPHTYRFVRSVKGTVALGEQRDAFEIVERAERSYAWRLVKQ